MHSKRFHVSASDRSEGGSPLRPSFLPGPFSRAPVALPYYVVGVFGGQGPLRGVERAQVPIWVQFMEANKMQSDVSRGSRETAR